MNKFLLVLVFFVFGSCVQAQEADTVNKTETTESSVAATKTPAKADKNNADKKMVREANINLQTTVTGNQEQPRVMYILPWQSPLSPELEMEMLSSQEDAVFGHIEREELARELEAADE